jgi:spore germination protein GerM
VRPLSRAAVGTGVGLALAATVAACGVAPEAAPRPIEGTLPAGLGETTTSTTTTTTVPITITIATSAPTTLPTTTAPSEAVVVYLVRTDGKLVPVSRAITQGADLGTILTEVQLEPTPVEEAAGLRTAVPRDAVLGVVVRGGTATIDLAPTFLDPSFVSSEQQLAAGQLTMTATERGPGVGRVRFTVGGKPIAVPRGDGSLPQATDQSVSRDDYSQLVAKP